MTRVSTHVLDIAAGKPARGVPVRLDRREAHGVWRLLSSCKTGDDGRCAQLLPEGDPLTPGVYRLSFDSATYFFACHVDGFYPVVEVTFVVRPGEEHFHLPLLLGPHSYTTYRGS